MRISLTAYDMPARDLLDLAIAADEVGFHAVWLGEHIVLPLGFASEHPTKTHPGVRLVLEPFAEDDSGPLVTFAFAPIGPAAGGLQ